MKRIKEMRLREDKQDKGNEYERSIKEVEEIGIKEVKKRTRGTKENFETRGKRK